MRSYGLTLWSPFVRRAALPSLAVLLALTACGGGSHAPARAATVLPSPTSTASTPSNSAAAPAPTGAAGSWTATGHSAYQGQLVVAGGTVAFLDDPKGTHAVDGLPIVGLDATTGKVRWSVPVPVAAGQQLVPAEALGGAADVPLAGFSTGQLLATVTTSGAASGIDPGTAAASHVIALDPSSGKVLWQAPGHVSDAPSGLVITTNGSNTLSVLDAQTGRQLWKGHGVEQGADEHAVLTAGPGQTVVADDVRTGRRLWSAAGLAPAGETLQSETALTVGGGTALLSVVTTGSSSGAEMVRLVPVSTMTGRPIGPALIDGSMGTAEAVTDSGVTVVAAPGELGLRALIETTGKPVWSLPKAAISKVTPSMRGGGGDIWVHGGAGDVVLDIRTGKTIASGDRVAFPVALSGTTAITLDNSMQPLGGPVPHA